MTTYRSMKLAAVAIGFLVALAGCGGTKVLKAPLAGEQVTTTVAVHDGVAVSVEGLIYRDGPGSWARKAYWDEYQVRVANAAGETIEIERVVLVDALDHEVAASSDRRSLQKGTKENLRRYKDAGIKVAPGAPPGGTMLAGGALVVGGVATLSSATTAGLAGMGGAGSVAAAGAGVVLGGAVLIGKGVNRAIQNNRIQDALTERAWTGDSVAASSRLEGSVFFPLVPAPRSLVVYYRDADAKTHAVEVPLPPELASLHRGSAK